MRLIVAIWIVLGCVWLVAAKGVKTAARRQSIRSRMGQVALLFCAFLTIEWEPLHTGVLGTRLVPDSPAIVLAGIIVTALGATVAVWARLKLGSNWSGTVTVKQDHELIRTGPYRVVRHPIYSGLLLAYLGTAIAIGEIRGLIGLILAFAGFWWKSRTEEAFMMAQFGLRYAQYRREVKALIPFLI
jgi:protein-S-isoprenylcysteine O-methyltransferase Ste14